MKNFIYSQSVGRKPMVQALVLGAARHAAVLRRAFDAVPAICDQLLDDQPRTEAARQSGVWKPLCYVLGYDLLFGQGAKKCGGGAVMRLLLANRAALDRAVEAARDLMPAEATAGAVVGDDAENESGAGGQGGDLPRYLRINWIRWRQPGNDELPPVADVLRALTDAGFEGATIDPDLPSDLLVLPPGTNVHRCALVRSGHLVQQDKASCFTALALAPSVGAHCLDACAAPGNKTAQLAAAVGPSGRVFAVDRDRKRLAVLRQQMSVFGADDVVEARCQDFLRLKPGDPQFAQVKFILCDPSCSGSGLVKRALLDFGGDGGPSMPPASAPPLAATGDETGDDDQAAAAWTRSTTPLPSLAEATPHFEDEGARLRKLAAFQRRILIHSMQFPAVERVAYSTCSVHVEENEHVVENVLRNPSVRGRFRLVAALPKWPRRGFPETGTAAPYCVRTDPELDRTNGFFVAVFQRCTDAERAAFAAAQPDAESASGDTPATAAGDRKKRPKKSNKRPFDGSRGSSSSIAGSKANKKKKQKQSATGGAPPPPSHRPPTATASSGTIAAKKKRRSIKKSVVS